MYKPCHAKYYKHFIQSSLTETVIQQKQQQDEKGKKASKVNKQRRDVGMTMTYIKNRHWIFFGLEEHINY